MKHILCIIIVLSIFCTSGCTIVFKAKEIELESVPPISKLIVPAQIPQLVFFAPSEPVIQSIPIHNR